MFLQSLLELLTIGSSHHHNIHLSIPTLIFQSLQWRTLATDIIPPRHRCYPDEGPPHAPSDVPCRSCMTNQTSQQNSAAICALDGLPQYSHTYHSWIDSVRSHCTS